MNSDHSPKNKHAISKTRSTSVDVTKLAGVSQATVSRAFDSTSKMRPQTRAKVFTAAKQLKYTPDAIAKRVSYNLQKKLYIPLTIEYLFVQSLI